MTKLHVGSGLSLPLDWMTLATVVYGARGSGKTTLGSVIAEEVTKAKQRFGAVDLKGDWYGLKSTADGKGDGIPVVVFGGDHQDVPLEPDAGAFVAETVAGMGQSWILDLEYFSKGKQIRFLASFFETLYDRNREPLLLLMDEAQRYAPQKPIDPDSAKCLGAVEDLVKLGRKHGIGPVLFTQRGSGLNKEVSELCDMLVAFRTPGPLDQDRVKDWLDANTTKAQRDEVMGKLAGLDTGTAVFASGHPDLRIFGVYQVRRRETFDSSATPKVGHRKQEPKRLAKPDLEQLRVRMAAAIERQKADDPKALRTTIATLRKELEAERRRQPEPAKTETKRVEVPVLKDDQVVRLERAIEKLTAAADTIANVGGLVSSLSNDITFALKSARSAPPPSAAPARSIAGSNGGGAVRAAGKSSGQARVGMPVAKDPRGYDTRSSRSATTVIGDAARSPERAEGLTPAQQRLIDTIALIEQLGIEATRDTVAAWYGTHPNSKGFGNNLSALRSAGYLEGVRLTEQGLGIANDIPMPTQEEVRERILSPLTPAQRRIVDVLLEHGRLTRDELAGHLGTHPNSKGYGNNLSALRTRQIITRGSPIEPGRVLFLNGVPA